MKKQVLIGLAAFASLATLAQNSHRTIANPKAKKVATFRPIKAQEVSGQTSSVANQTKKTAGAPYKRIGGSANVFGVTSTDTRAVQYNADINTVGFVYRQGSTWTGIPNYNSGTVSYAYTSNNGSTWDSTVVATSTTNFHRYPAGAMYNPAANTNPANAFAVVSGPWHPGSNWQGVFMGSKQLSIPGTTANGNVIYSDNLALTSTQRKQDFARTDMQVTSNGNVYVLGDIARDVNDVSSVAAYGWRGAMINKGVYNAGTFTWTVDSLIPNFKLESGGDPISWSAANMAWSENGQTGYVVFYGVDANASVGTSQNSYQPLVYKTTDAGGTWARHAALFDFTTISAVNDRLFATQNNTVLAKPFIAPGEGSSATVDANGDLHLFCSMQSSYWDDVAAGPDDSTGYTISPNQFNVWTYLYDFKTTATGWDAMIVDSLSCDDPTSDASDPSGVGNSNWLSSGTPLAYDARLQISRTTDGNHIVYSWADSDSTIVPTAHVSTLPDIFMKGYDVVNNKMTCKKNMSLGKSEFQYSSYWFYSSPRIAKPTSTSFLIPATTSKSTDGSNDGDISIDHYYMDDAMFTASEFTVTVNTPGCTASTGVGIKEENSSVANLNFYPNPASTNGTIEVVLNENAKMDIVVLNSVGQKVYATSVAGNTGSNKVDINLNNLSSGLYFYQVKIADAKAITKKFVVNK